MTTLLVPEIARSSMAPLRSALGKRPKTSKEDLLDACAYFTGILEGFRPWIDGFVDRGTEVQQLRRIIGEGLVILIEAAHMLAAARDSLSERESEARADLEANVRQVLKVRNHFQALLGWLRAAPGGGDLVGTLRQIERDQKARGFEGRSAEEIEAGLRESRGEDEEAKHWREIHAQTTRPLPTE
jgi:hypothetical protein